METSIGQILESYQHSNKSDIPAPKLEPFFYHNSDVHGNTLYVLNGSGKGYLKLSNETKTRDIGWIETPDGVNFDYCKNEKENEVFRKNDSWSINYAMMMIVNRYIYFKTEKGTYRIHKTQALKVGSFLWFADAGIERKFYVERKFWQFAAKK